jgi:hypothetical protein
MKAKNEEATLTKACVVSTIVGAIFTLLGLGVHQITGDPNMLVGAGLFTSGMLIATLGSIWIFKDEQ